MKKRLLIIFSLVGLMMSSCLKDGFNDFDALNHDMTIQGTIHPTLGIPIAHGSMSIYDLLQMVQITVADVEIGEDGIITVVYDTAIKETVYLDNSKGRSKSRARRNGPQNSDDIVHVSRNTIQGSVLIDLFDNFHTLDSAEMEVDHLYLNVDTYVRAQAREGALAAMDTFHVQVYYDSLYIEVVGQDNSTFFIPIPDTIPIDSLIIGDNIKLFDNVDISQAINIRPKEIHYGARMNIAFEAEFFATGLTENQFVADSIGVTSVDINGQIKASFPISAYINDVRYGTDIQFSPSFDMGELVIDSSMIYLECNNSIPMELVLTAAFADSLDNFLCNLLDPTPTTIPGAPVTLDNNGRYSSNGASKTIINIPVTKTVFDNLKKTKKIKLNASISTSNTNNTANNKVAIKSTDMLDLRLYAKIKPSYNLNIDMGSNNNDNNGSNKKGGKR